MATHDDTVIGGGDDDGRVGDVIHVDGIDEERLPMAVLGRVAIGGY